MIRFASSARTFGPHIHPLGRRLVSDLWSSTLARARKSYGFCPSSRSDAFPRSKVESSEGPPRTLLNSPTRAGPSFGPCRPSTLRSEENSPNFSLVSAPAPYLVQKPGNRKPLTRASRRSPGLPQFTHSCGALRLPRSKVG